MSERYGVPLQAGSIRNIQGNKLVANIDKPGDEAMYSQAEAYFRDPRNVEDPQKFHAAYKRLRARGAKGHQDFLAVLHALASDPLLSAYKSFTPAAQDASQNIPRADKRDAAAAQAKAAAAQNQPGAPRGLTNAQVTPAPTTKAPGFSFPTAHGQSSLASQQQQAQQQPPQQTLNNITNLAPGSGHGYTTPMASMPAVTTPVAGLAQPSDGSASGVTPFLVGAAATGVTRPGGVARPNSAQHAQQSAGMESPKSTGGKAYYSNNPVYNQEDANSPAMQAKNYQPSLATTISVRYSSRSRDPQPAIPLAGDLFVLPGSGRSAAAGQAAAPESAFQMPAWNSSRPALTGLDIVQEALSGRSETSRAQEAVSTLPPSLQELAVMNDLLYAFMGINGKYIKAKLVQPPPAASPQQPAPGTVPSTPAPGGPAAAAAAGVVPEGGPALTFMVEVGLEPCLQEMVERVLPICDYVVVLQRYIETRTSQQHGLVSNAVAATLRSLLDDWLLMVTQLENQLRLGSLSLQSLTFYCQEPLAALRLLAGIAAEAASKQLSAAGMLNLLQSKSAALSGDHKGRSLVHRLLHAACIPYFATLERWLCEGVLDDPRGEFMVQEDKGVSKDALTADKQLAYWYNRYTLRLAPGSSPAPSSASGDRAGLGLDVPVFLQSHAGVILTTGKYLNAIRECGQPVVRPAALTARLQYDPHCAFLQHVVAAHSHASSSLLQLLVGGAALRELLSSIKHYFLLDQGDVLVHLIDGAHEELAKPARDISATRMQSLLEMAIKSSSVAADPLTDNLGFELNPDTLTQLARSVAQQERAGLERAGTLASGASVPSTPFSPAFDTRSVASHSVAGGSRTVPRRGEDAPAWEFFNLTYRLSWPMTLVVSPKQLSQYQLIFKLLFSLKHTERQVALTWHRLASASRAREGRRRVWDAADIKRASAFCQRLTFFIQEYLRYATLDVLEPLWTHMEGGIRRATNVDEVIRCHRTFLSKALDGLLLSRPRILRTISLIDQLAQTTCVQLDKVFAKWEAAVDLAQTTAQAAAQAAPAAARKAGAAAPAATSAAAAVLAAAATAKAQLAALQQQQGVPDLQGLGAEFGSRLNDLLVGLQELHLALMKREGGSSSQQQQQQPGAGGMMGMSMQDTAPDSEELERLQNLMSRLSVTCGSKETSHAGITLEMLSMSATTY